MTQQNITFGGGHVFLRAHVLSCCCLKTGSCTLRGGESNTVGNKSEPFFLGRWLVFGPSVHSIFSILQFFLC